ncbi:MAG: sarcosine oxidase subunit delta [Rhizobiaceae bacterium]|jgi:sarcosine oxidase subunit delta|nr:sarcosine oxidase subunit delta [Rhizobiaceae bacterium]
MRIPCPFCGLRDGVEFSYQGDANRTRPDPVSVDQTVWNDHVFNRVNTRGVHREFWLHNHGCRAHLVVERNTVTHEIVSVALARQFVLERKP